MNIFYRWLILFTLLLPQVVFSQVPPDSLGRSGNMGLGIVLTGGSTLIPTAIGGGIVGKYWLGNQDAFVGGLIFDLMESSENNEKQGVATSDSSSKSSVGITFIGRWEKHFAISKTVSPYLTPGLAYSFSKVTTTSITQNIKTIEDGLSIAATCGIGIEYFFTPLLSIAIQSGIYGRYSSIQTSSNKINDPAKSSLNRKTSWTLGISSAAIALTIYF